MRQQAVLGASAPAAESVESPDYVRRPAEQRSAERTGRAAAVRSLIIVGAA